MTDTASPIEQVIAGRTRDLGSFTVSRLLPAPQRRLVGPFIFLDHMGPLTIAPGVGFDVRPHPHIGLSTVTYLYAGENMHRDNIGSVQRNVPGDINLMTAGAGIVHSERADAAWRARGGELHGVQFWLALPDANEDDAPSFEHVPAARLPTLAPAAGVTARVLFGAAFGARSPVEHPSAPTLVDLALAAGASVTLPADLPEACVFVVAGEITVDGRRVVVDELAVVRPGAAVTVTATTASQVMWLGGPPVGARLIEWNFVASSAERIARASAAWRAQSLPKIPGDDREFVPLPDFPHHVKDHE